MVTQREIAERLGLRQATVSRVLSGCGPVAEDTQRQVLAMASQLGYRPNLAARSMRRGTYGSLAYVVNTRSHYNLLDAELLLGIESRLSEVGQHLILSRVPSERFQDPGAATILLDTLACDALLIGWVGDMPPEIHASLAKARIPAVRVNARAKDNAVNFHDYKGGEAAVAACVGLGHRRLAFLDMSMGTSLAPEYFHYSNRERWEACTATARELGATIERWAPAEPLPHETRARIVLAREYLARADRPSAIIAYGYESDALPLLIAARDLGLEVPRDVSLLSFARRSEELFSPPLAIVHLDFHALGRAAAGFGLDLVAGRGRSLAERRLDPTVIANATLAPAR